MTDVSMQDSIQILTATSGTVKPASKGDPWTVLFPEAKPPEKERSRDHQGMLVLLHHEWKYLYYNTFTHRCCTTTAARATPHIVPSQPLWQPSTRTLTFACGFGISTWRWIKCIIKLQCLYMRAHCRRASIEIKVQNTEFIRVCVQEAADNVPVEYH